MLPRRGTVYGGPMLTRHLLFFVTTTSLATLANWQEALAVGPGKCSTLVAQCVSESSSTRSACFKKFAGSSLCSMLPVGRILETRVKYMPQARGIERRVRPRTGATPVDGVCLDNFDIQLRNAIDFGPIDSDREAALLAQLRRCAMRSPTTSLATTAESAGARAGR